MSGFVENLTDRLESILEVSEVLRFPWDLSFDLQNIEQCLGGFLAEDIISSIESPPFTRSLRDGYAVLSEDISGATSSYPVYLNLIVKFYGKGAGQGS